MRLLVPLLLAGTSLAAADWPQWRGPTRDGHAPGLAAPVSWPKTLSAGWKVPVGAGHASPLVVGDRVFE